MSEWRPIETVPLDGTAVLVYLEEPRHHSRVHAAFFLPNVSCGVIGGLFGFDMPRPTHWMPLPSEPSKP